MTRRQMFSKLASLLGLGLLGQQASAATWTKIQSASGSGTKWRKFGATGTASGQIQAFGFNQAGTLGDNTVTDRCMPVTVCGITNAVAIGAGDEHSLALLSDGTLRAWGNNGNGRLGNNSTTNTSTPVAVCGISTAVFVSGGANASYAVLRDGTIRAWGSNGNRELGDNTTTDRSTPVQVCGITNAISVYSAGATGHALLSNGCVMSWGYPACGNIGDNTCASRPTPVTVCCISTAVQIHAGMSFYTTGHTLALLSNGTVMAWGNGGNGQINNCATTIASMPVALTGMSNVIAISAGFNSAHALTADGKVYSWGDNSNGQFGNGTNTGAGPSYACVSNVVAMVAGSAQTLTI